MWNMNHAGRTARLARLRLVALLAVVLGAGLVSADAHCPDRTPNGNLYWGDLHVHSAFSFDSSTWDVRAMPKDAYRFARGEQLLLPPLDEQGKGTRPARLERALDFAVVTDHSELMGELALCTDSESEVYDTDECRLARGEGGSPDSRHGRPRPFSAETSWYPSVVGFGDHWRSRASPTRVWQLHSASSTGSR